VVAVVVVAEAASSTTEVASPDPPALHDETAATKEMAATVPATVESLAKVRGALIEGTTYT